MLLLSTLQQFDIDPVDFFIVLATAGLALFFVLASLATPVMGVVTECLYTAKRKSFYDKCALQITQAAFGMGIFIFLVLGGGAAYYTVSFQPDLAAALPAVDTQAEAVNLPVRVWQLLGPMVFFIPLLVGLCLVFLYQATWSALKKHRAFHLFLGWLAALLMLAILFSGLLLIANVKAPLLLLFLFHNPLPVLASLLGDFFSSPTLPLMFLTLLCTGLAAGAGLSQLWLIMRRFRADYGRDYYGFAMRYCARLALGFTLAAAGIGAGLYFLLRYSIPPELTQPQDIGVALIAAGLPLCCCLLWLSIAKSETPLRHKPGAFFACVFLFIALCAQLLMLASTFPMA